MINYIFSQKSQRYYDKTNGKFVSVAQVRDAVNQNLRSKAEIAQDIAESYISNQITKQEFKSLMKKLLKTTYIQNYKIGKPVLTNADKKHIQERLIKEYVFLENYINSLDKLSNAQIIARAKLYFANLSSLNEGQRRSHRENNWYWERRKLNIAEHCPQCVQFFNMGWQRLGTLPPIGTQSNCLMNCKCYFEFSKSLVRPK